MTESEGPPRHYGGVLSIYSCLADGTTHLYDLEQILSLKYIPSNTDTPSSLLSMFIIDLLQYLPCIALLYLGEPILNKAFTCMVKAVLSNIQWGALIRSFKSARHVRK